MPQHLVTCKIFKHYFCYVLVTRLEVVYATFANVTLGIVALRRLLRLDDADLLPFGNTASRQTDKSGAESAVC